MIFRLKHGVLGAFVVLAMVGIVGEYTVATLDGVAARSIATQAEESAAATKKVLNLLVLEKGIQLDVVQVQQFLTDVSATRGLDGLDDGFAVAAEHAESFETKVAAAKALAAELGARTTVSALDAVSTAFVPYYALGQTMARAYVAEGPAAGNRLMGEFDATAQTIGSAVADMDEAVRSVLAEIDARRESVAATADADLRMAEWIAIALVGLTIAFAVLAGLFVSRRLLRPLSAATEALRRLADGDDAATLAGTDRSDEIGDLARAFASFREGLVARRHAEAAADAHRRESEAAARRMLEAEKLTGEQQAFIVSEIGAGLSSLAAGDLGARLTRPFPQTYESLRADFNGAMEQLSSVMGRIAASAGSVRSGSSEISQASDDLARRTEQQAASLEQTASTLAQIVSLAERTAKGAGTARGIVQETVADARQSGSVVGEAAEAMAAIQGSSQRISQIVGVIDEIAFQTNLLALNAGVEAARAGEAGRGFAIVAQEVRALAQRSATAADEIKMLIEASSGEVERGVGIVSRTGETLKAIVARVGRIEEVTEEITVAAREQASGLAEVNTAVHHMDQTTQQNAAMVEETSAAARTLYSESDNLGALLAIFEQVGGKSAAAPRRAA